MSKPKSSVIAIRVVGPLAPYSWQFASLLAERGYTPLSRDNQLRVMGHLSKWLCAGGLDVGGLTFARVAGYLAPRRAEGYSSFCSRASLKQLSDLLARCAAPLVEPMVPGSEVGALLAGLPVTRGRSWVGGIDDDRVCVAVTALCHRIWPRRRSGQRRCDAGGAA